ncbi:hypothetical protein Bca4012_030075 [Brassica carinata]|uniref:Uncharacterized protein n=1 Tax=Brassica oleracea TaxID=3712 RepID=A0A3P6BZU2_BRAOL|nr:unnamed protein product [Brassica oleracea]
MVIIRTSHMEGICNHLTSSILLTTMSHHKPLSSFLIRNNRVLKLQAQLLVQYLILCRVHHAPSQQSTEAAVVTGSISVETDVS